MDLLSGWRSEVQVGAPRSAPEGDERLSGTKRGDGEGPGDVPGARPARIRKDKASPVGRALRSVYDDTLREAVPDDFMDLLRKLD